MQVLEMEIGAQSYNFCVESDAKRIQYAERALTDAAKEARFNLQSSRKENEEEYMNTFFEIGTQHNSIFNIFNGIFPTSL